MANQDAGAGNPAVQQSAEAEAEGRREEQTHTQTTQIHSEKSGTGREEGEGRRTTTTGDEDEVRLWWSWRRLHVRPHRASVVAACCFVIVLTLTISLPLLLVPGRPRRAGTDQPLPVPANAPRIDLNYSRYVGAKLPNGVNAFLGMRYAAAPLGDLRWRAPVDPPYSAMSSEPALAFQPTCLGNGVSALDPSEDEDCLFVNVWTPSNATVNSNLPVWVFIQGGGYVFNSNANYDGAEVVEKSGYNIIMVNFNYRVGLWGFLASERLRDDGDLNVGLLDQRRLLLWVKQYISRFGGDPNHVVLNGGSAGAGSVALHLSAYGGRDDGLFVGAISESLFFPAQPYVAELEWQFDRVLQSVGCEPAYGSGSNDTIMPCLRAKDVSVLQPLNIAGAFPGRTAPPNPLFYWTPCVDGDLIQHLPYVLFQTGRFIRMPVMFGTDTDEGSTFAADAATPDDVSSFLGDNYPNLLPSDTDLILSLYSSLQLPPLPFHKAWFPTASLAYGEATFTCPSLNLLKYMSSSPSYSQGKIWSYRYNVADAANTASGVGVPHLFEAAAVFGPGSIPDPVAASYSTYNAPVVPVVMGYWISFVRALDPNVFAAPGAPVWGPWDGMVGGQRLRVETNDSCMESVDAVQWGRCAFWEGLAGRMRQK